LIFLIGTVVKSIKVNKAKPLIAVLVSQVIIIPLFGIDHIKKKKYYNRLFIFFFLKKSNNLNFLISII